MNFNSNFIQVRDARGMHRVNPDHIIEIVTQANCATFKLINGDEIVTEEWYEIERNFFRDD